MADITHLLFEKCKIVRTTSTRDADGVPVDSDAVIVDNVRCRLDKGMALTYANMIRGSMRAEQVAGVIYIDGASVDDTGAPLVIKPNERITVKGATTEDDREYEAFMINRVPGLTGPQHWEIGVLNVENA